jgi:hypothetical protein
MKTLSSGKYFKDLVLLFFLTLIVYWPLSLNYLSLKNDALVYFAYRYHLSEAIRHGHLPFWSPYFYTGFPIHADIQGGVWNPLALLLSLIGKYDMVLLQWEVVIYLFVSSVGMYRLIKYFGLSRLAAICSAVSFMSCGYMTDSISIVPWIPSAAFIPFVLLYFFRLLKSPISSVAVKFSIALSLMFLCGYPSFFIYLNYIIIISFLIWMIHYISNNNKNAALKAFLYLGIAYLLFLLICSPAIISYYEFLPYYSRGVGISYQRATENPFVPFSFISYLLPNIMSKATFLSTDLSMRNTYIGLFIFIFFLTGLKKLDRFKMSILGFTIFSFLFSLGDLTPVQKFCFYFLPLMDTFRHPGTIRVFTSIGMILLAAYPLNAFFKLERDRKLNWLCYIFLVALLVTCIDFVATIPSQNNYISFTWSRSTLKQFLHSMSFQKFAMFICILQIIFVMLFLSLQQPKRFSKKTLATLVILNSILFAWIGLPFTVVSQYKTTEVNNFIQSFPDGYPLPNINASIGAEVYSSSIQISPHGYPNFYNKKITIQDHIITPTINKDYNQFLENKSLRLQLKDHPFIYVSTDSVSIQPAKIKVLEFTTNRFSFNVNSPVAGNLQLFQQYNPNWHVSVNHKPVQILKSNIAFMSVNIPAGPSLIEWKYSPKKVYIGMILSALSLLAIVFYFAFKKKQERTHD